MSGRPWRKMNENVLDGRHAQAAEFAARDFMSGGGGNGRADARARLVLLFNWTALKLVSIASDGRAADA